MEIFIIIALLIAGIILLLIEVFLIPGIGMAGVGATGCYVYANYYAFASMGTIAGFITLIITIISSVAIFLWFIRSKSLDKLALKKNISSSVKNKNDDKIKIGDTGIALTRLALIGNAEINGHIVEVKSSGEFIAEKAAIVVERISDNIIIVGSKQ